MPKQPVHRDLLWVFGRSPGTWENEPRGQAWATDVCLGSSRSSTVIKPRKERPWWSEGNTGDYTAGTSYPDQQKWHASFSISHSPFWQFSSIGLSVPCPFCPISWYLLTFLFFSVRTFLRLYFSLVDWLIDYVFTHLAYMHHSTFMAARKHLWEWFLSFHQVCPGVISIEDDLTAPSVFDKSLYFRARTKGRQR